MEGRRPSPPTSSEDISEEIRDMPEAALLDQIKDPHDKDILVLY